MNLSGLLAAIREQPAYVTALASISAPGGVGHNVTDLNLPRSARAPILAALAIDTRRPLLLLADHSDRALEMHDELASWQGELPMRLFAEPNALFYDRTAWGTRAVRKRLACLAAFASSVPEAGSGQKKDGIISVTSARALMMRTLPVRDFHSNMQVLRVGNTIRLSTLMTAWQGMGYSSQSLVVEPGQFSRRGGIVDIWTPSDSHPIRIELFGDEVDNLRCFDPASQRSEDNVDEVTIAPAREALPAAGPSVSGRLVKCWPRSPIEAANDDQSGSIWADFDLLAEGVSFPHLEYYLPWIHPEPATLLDYLPRNCIVAVDDWQAFVDAVHKYEEQALKQRNEYIDSGFLPLQAPDPYVSWSDLQDQLSTSSLLLLGGGGHDFKPEANLASSFSPSTRFGGHTKKLVDHLETLRLSEESAVIITNQAARLAELWGENEMYFPPVETVLDVPQPGSLLFVQGAMAEGFTLRTDRYGPLHVITDAEIFGWRPPKLRQRVQAQVAATSPEDAFAEFQVGECIVHVEYGIGRYRRLVQRTVDGVEGEYIHVEYAGGDDLYVPVSRVDRLTRYVGIDGHMPELSSLGSAEWASVRERTRQAVDEVARELLKLYAKRDMSQGHSFAPDGPWQAELEASFPYSETKDQRSALEEVKVDMENVRPMDRLICGDVGYGKTEVALRAAFKSVVDGKQVALLAPTTVLAQQHFHTFQRRLAAFPVKVEMLSRFRSRVQQRQIIADITSGEVDIVIGTHRMLQSDVHFNDLGLVIVDEEQRFGVTHKEHLKRMRTEVDVLAMTATPIPRTLYLTLTGLRDISTVNTPPDERLPVISSVGPYKRNLVRQAILRELSRQGQVFYVHNRVQTITAAQQRLAEAVPEARLAIAHGQMAEHQLEKVMREFNQGDHDVLICTTIIESGLDIPNANTLIVEQADTFGLAQLYQLRGRVGRGSRRAHAFFFYQADSLVTPEARERLDSIADQTALGAGYGIAMRDLEIRGAGDILGKRQHGHVAAVGFHLYTRLLRRAVEQLKSGDEGRFAVSLQANSSDLSLVSVDLPLNANISSDYIDDQRLRLQIYRRLADLEAEKELLDMDTELDDRFGSPPPSVRNLLYLLHVRMLANQANVSSVVSERGMILLRSNRWQTSEACRKLEALLPLGARVTTGKVWLYRDQEPGVWKKDLLGTLRMLAEDPL